MNLVIVTAVLFTFLATILRNTDICYALQSNSLSLSNNLFATDLSYSILFDKPTENVVFSPASIYAGLALTYLGADGRTADEIAKVLRLGLEDKRAFASQYRDLLKRTFANNKHFDVAPELKMVNRLYASDRFDIFWAFNIVAKKYLDSVGRNVQFSKPLVAVDEINEWVRKQTQYKITILMRDYMINGNTSAILVNSLYFEARWLDRFRLFSTHKRIFRANSSQKRRIPTMYIDSWFGYAELPELDCKALEMPLEKSDISMLIILPNKIEGLQKLLKKLKGTNLNDIKAKMVTKNVDLILPEFRIKSEIDLKGPLGTLGCSSMFERNANLTNMFESEAPKGITSMWHKAVLQCSESGLNTRAAIPLLIPKYGNESELFHVDHPFFFAVHNKDMVFLAGHMVNAV